MTLILIEHFHGAATRVGEADTAFPHRNDGYNALIASQWQDVSETEQNVAWTRETYSAMQPFMGSGRYVNYLGEDEGEDPVADAYGPNYNRLRELKKKYDPNNLFRLNQNIRPG